MKKTLKTNIDANMLPPLVIPVVLVVIDYFDLTTLTC